MLSGDYKPNVGDDVYFKDSIIHQAMKKYNFVEGLLFEVDGMVGNHKDNPTYLPNDTHIQAVFKYSEQFSLKLFFNNGEGNSNKCFSLKVSLLR